MTYLSTAEVAEIKGCTPQYVRRLVQNGKLRGETKDNAANNRTEYIIPLTALPQDLQLKWENQQRRSLGLEPVKKAVKAPLKTENARLTLDDLTDKQRSELYLWTGIIKDWLTIRDGYEQYSKGEIDEMFVQAARLKYPDLEISTDILYRRLKAYRNSDISGLIDKRGGSNKGRTTTTAKTAATCSWSWCVSRNAGARSSAPTPRGSFPTGSMMNCCGASRKKSRTGRRFCITAERNPGIIIKHH